MGLLAFYFPGVQRPCDELCGAGFLGNFYDLHQHGFDMQIGPAQISKCCEGMYLIFKGP